MEESPSIPILQTNVLSRNSQVPCVHRNLSSPLFGSSVYIAFHYVDEFMPNLADFFLKDLNKNYRLVGGLLEAWWSGGKISGKTWKKDFGYDKMADCGLAIKESWRRYIL